MKTMTAEKANLNHASTDKRDFNRWVFVFFVIFFVTALITRVLPKSMRPLASSERVDESVYEEAMHAAHYVVPFIFALH